MNNLHTIQPGIPLWVKQLICAWEEVNGKHYIAGYRKKDDRVSIELAFGDEKRFMFESKETWLARGWDFYMNKADLTKFNKSKLIIT